MKSFRNHAAFSKLKAHVAQQIKAQVEAAVNEIAEELVNSLDEAVTESIDGVLVDDTFQESEVNVQDIPALHIHTGKVEALHTTAPMMPLETMLAHMKSVS